MSKNKQARLLEKFGQNMAESAGATGTVSDRYEGFIASRFVGGEMALDRIVEDPGQPRKSFDENALLLLADSIKNDGVRSPIEVRWSDEHDKWLIVFGHRRYRAAILVGLKTIPCMFTDDQADEPTIRMRQLVENCQREDLVPMEMARAIKALAELTGWSNRKIAEKLSLSHTSIGRYVDLLKLPEALQEKVNTGELALSVGIELLRLEDPTQQEGIGREITAKKLPRSEAKRLIDHALSDAEPMNVEAKTSPEKRLLTKNVDITIYRNPFASDFKIQKELLAAAALLDPEKLEN